MAFTVLMEQGLLRSLVAQVEHTEMDPSFSTLTSVSSALRENTV